MYDAIVIGSGIGGLTAAGLLAGVADKKVLVLEKHTEPGGLTHVFRRDGASWDVGVHYLGEVEPGSQGRALFDYLSGGKLQWNRMTDSFDHFIYPKLHFKVPSNPEQYEAKLKELFPEEKSAIRQYFIDIRLASKWAILGITETMTPKFIAPILKDIRYLIKKNTTKTTKEYLEENFQSPQLRALLVSQWGDYGLTPKRSAFAIHAMIVNHYLHGAWFPQGGSSRIARTFEQGIESKGGSIRVAQEVTEILIENGHAVGVKVIDRRGPNPIERTYLAPIVISNVGVELTYKTLLPTSGEIGKATVAIRSQIDEIGVGNSAVTLYIRLKTDVRSIGVEGENYWIYTDLDHDDTKGQTEDLMKGNPRSIFVSFPSIKSGEEHFHTAEIIGNIDPSVFERWRLQPKGNREAEYSILKKVISDGLLRLAETAIPGIGKLVEYSELSTPLTVEHYTSHKNGAFYGLPATPERYRSNLFGPKSPIEGLYISGQDAACLGVLGAMMGGVGAASNALGSRGYPMIQAALKQPSHNVTVAITLPVEKRSALLQAKQQLTSDIWDVTFKIEGTLTEFAPGQFARLHVGNSEWRDYSIAGLDRENVRFLISTRTGGHGSQFIESATVGTRTEIELPLGEYALTDSPSRKIFIATGTGLAPFLPMFRSLDQSQLNQSVLVFGCKTVKDDITTSLSPLPINVIRCISRETNIMDGVQGRVTDVLETLDFDLDTTDFYVCGASAMVADCKALLEKRGALHIYIESY